MKLISWLRKIIAIVAQLGFDSSKSQPLNEAVKLSNLIALAGFIGAIPYPLIYAGLGAYGIMIVQASFCLSLLGVLWLNYTGRTLASRILLIQGSNAMVAVAVSSFGTSSGFGHLFLLSLVTPLIMFDRQEALVRNSNIVTTFVWFSLSVYGWIPPLEVGEIGTLITTPTAYLVQFMLASLLILVEMKLLSDSRDTAELSLSKAIEHEREQFEARIKAEELIAQQQFALIATARLRSIAEMSAGVAHEINNPLAAVGTIAFRLRKCLTRGDFASIEKHLDLLDQTTERMARIVRGLLAFAGEGDVPVFEAQTMHKIIETTVGLCEERFRHHKVALSVEVCEESPLVNCDYQMIGQILINLLNNALYAALEGDAAKKVRIVESSTSDMVEVRVYDSGKGVPPEIVNNIMTPFFTTKPVGVGTGLGLSVSKGIAERHGGSLELDTSTSSTCFVLRIPIVGIRKSSRVA
jgi:signal transduction histidine kinase